VFEQFLHVFLAMFTFVMNTAFGQFLNVFLAMVTIVTFGHNLFLNVFLAMVPFGHNKPCSRTAFEQFLLWFWP